MRPLLTIVVALWVARGIGELAFCQERRTPLPTSTVTVVAVNIAGDPLPGTDVYSFVAEDETERVDLFQHDRASRVPYGRYRLSVQANGGYRETTLYVTVSAPEVRVTAALQWYGVENDLGLGRFAEGSWAEFPARLASGAGRQGSTCAISSIRRCRRKTRRLISARFRADGTF